MIDFTEPVECDKGPITHIVFIQNQGIFEGNVLDKRLSWEIESGKLVGYKENTPEYTARNAVEEPSVDLDEGRPMWYHKKSHVERQMLIGFAKAALIGLLSNSNRDLADENIPKVTWNLAKAMMKNRPEEM